MAYGFPAPKQKTPFEQLADSIATSLSSGQRAIGQTSAAMNVFEQSVGRATGAVRGMHNAMLGIASTIYVFEQIGGAIKDYLIDPFADFTKGILNATTQAKQFENAISSVAGSLSKARQINQELIALSRSSPLTVDQLRESALATAYQPALAGRIGFGTAADAAAQALSFGRVSGKLSQIDPQQGVAGALISIREAMESDFGSLQRRFGISTGALGGLSGVAPSALRGDSDLLLKALERYTNVFVSDEAFDRTSRTIENRFAKIQDAIDAGLARIGNSGVYDHVSDRLGKLIDSMFSYLDSPQFAQRAQQVSDSITKVVDNTASAINKLLSAVPGKPDLGAVAGVVDTTASIMDKLALASEALPRAADALGPAITHLTGRISEFISAVVAIAETSKNPQEFTKRITGFDRPPIGVIRGGLVDRVFGPFEPKSYTDYKPDYSRPAPTTRPATEPAESVPDIVRDIIRAEYQPNFSALVQSAIMSNRGLSSLAGRSTSPFERLADASSRAIGGIGPLLEQLDSKYTMERSQLDTAILAGRNQMAWDSGNKTLADSVAELVRQRDKLAQSFLDATKTIQGAKLDALADYSAALSQSLDQLAPSAAATLADRIMRGTTSYADRMLEMLGGEPPQGRSAAFGLLSLPLDRQRATIQQYIGFGVAARQQDTRLTPRQVRASIASFLEGDARDRISGLYSRSIAGYATSGSDIDLGMMQSAASDLKRVNHEVSVLRHGLDETALAFEQFSGRSRSAIENGLGNAIANIIKGTGSMRDVLLGVVNDITQAFSQMIARNIVYGLVGDLGVPGAGPGGLGIGLAGGLLGGLLTSFSGNFFGGGHTIAGTAPGFAEGGIVTSPTFAMIGEGGMPEAVIPMPAGKVPVDLRGANERPIRIFAVASPEEAFAKGFNAHQDYMFDVFAGEISRPGKLQRAVRNQ